MPNAATLMSSTLDQATLMPRVMLYGNTRSQMFLFLPGEERRINVKRKSCVWLSYRNSNEVKKGMISLTKEH